MEELFKKSILAVVCLSISIPFLLMQPLLGSMLFPLGLYLICEKKLNLFTGKCGYIFFDKNLKTIDLLIILIINLIVAFLIGFVFGEILSGIGRLAEIKINNMPQGIEQFVKSVMCGMLMYLAVHFHSKQKPIILFLCVFLFLVSGFQHCIVNMIYFGICKEINISIIITICGNFVGSNILSIFFERSKK